MPQNAVVTPIGKLVDFCRDIAPHIDRFAFDESLTCAEQTKRAGAVMDEFLPLVTGAIRVCASHRQGPTITKLIHRLRTRLSELTQVAKLIPVRNERNDANSKTNRYMAAVDALKAEWMELDDFRDIAMANDDALSDPVPIAWLRDAITRKTCGGDVSSLRRWLKGRGVRIGKIGRKAYAERSDLLKPAICKKGTRTFELIHGYIG